LLSLPCRPKAIATNSTLKAKLFVKKQPKQRQIITLWLTQHEARRMGMQCTRCTNSGTSRRSTLAQNGTRSYVNGSWRSRTCAHSTECPARLLHSSTSKSALRLRSIKTNIWTPTMTKTFARHMLNLGFASLDT
jgi:hypothetical protein